MYNLLEYSKNNKKTTGSSWNYCRDEPNNGTDNNNITHSILNSESFDYKANFMENGVTHNNLTKNDVEIVIPLKYLSNCWRSLNIPLMFNYTINIQKCTFEYYGKYDVKMIRILFKCIIYRSCEKALNNGRVKSKIVRKLSLNFTFATPNSDKDALVKVFLRFEMVFFNNNFVF